LEVIPVPILLKQRKRKLRKKTAEAHEQKGEKTVSGRRNPWLKKKKGEGWSVRGGGSYHLPIQG